MKGNFKKILKDLVSWQFCCENTHGADEFRNQKEEDANQEKVSKKIDYFREKLNGVVSKDEMKNVLNELEMSFSGDDTYWSRVYYKKGIEDGINILALVRKYKDMGKDDTYESAFNEYIDDILSTVESKVYKECKEYKIANKRYIKFLMKNPQIEDFLESSKIDNITPKETQKIFEVIQLIKKMNEIRFKEGIRLGIKEGILS